MSSKQKVVRHDTNPFLENMVISKRDKRIQLSKLGKDDNVLINQSTGEIHGTHVTTFKRVDSEQFIKIFTANIGLVFDLKPAGIKALTILIWVMQEKALSKDLVALDSYVLQDFLENQEQSERPLKLSSSTFSRGIKELEDANIIAKHIRPGFYYINPNFIFNGDRIAFTTLIERNNQKNLN